MGPSIREEVHVLGTGSTGCVKCIMGRDEGSGDLANRKPKIKSFNLRTSNKQLEMRLMV